jgi:hypothetical protein
MDSWDERMQLLDTWRNEYSNIARATLIALSARAALLLTSATLVGTITNIYYSGLSSFKLAKVMPTGDIISLLGNTPRMLLTVFIAMLIGLIIVAIYSFDDELAQVQKRFTERGVQLEQMLGNVGGLMHCLQSLENQLQNGFLIARSVLFVIGLGWAGFFIFIGSV